MVDFFAVNTTIVGYRDVVRALSRYDKDSKKIMVSSIRKALRPVVTDARANVPAPTPMRGWRLIPPVHPQSTTRGGKGWPAWNTDEIKHGIRVSFRPSNVKSNRTRTVVSIKQFSASGTIYEFAKHSQKHATFISHLGYSTGGRLIWKAFDKHRLTVEKEINTAIRSGNANLQSSIFAAKDRGF